MAEIKDDAFYRHCGIDHSAGSVTCDELFRCADRMGADPVMLGEKADSLSIKVRQCRLGLLRRRKDPPHGAVRGPVRAAIDALSGNGSITCRQAWDIAELAGAAREEIGAACDVMGVKINSCQLGLF